jgi:hypothetical protein
MALLKYVNVDRSVINEELLRNNKLVVNTEEERIMHLRSICGRRYIFERYDTVSGGADIISIVEGKYYYFPATIITAPSTAVPLTLGAPLIASSRDAVQNQIVAYAATTTPSSYSTSVVAMITSIISMTAIAVADIPVGAIGFIIPVQLCDSNASGAV